MFYIQCHFSSIVLDEFVTPVEGKSTSTCEILDETELEDGDRVTVAPKLLDVQSRESDLVTLSASTNKP